VRRGLKRLHQQLAASRAPQTVELFRVDDHDGVTPVQGHALRAVDFLVMLIRLA
jgi:hypothetical protein